MYEQVLREGLADDVRRYIDVDQLLDLWPDMILARRVTRAWRDWLHANRGVDHGELGTRVSVDV